MSKKINETRKLMYAEMKKYKYYALVSFSLILTMQAIALIPPQIMSIIIDTYIPCKNLNKIYFSILLLCGIPLISTLVDSIFNQILYVNVRKFSSNIKQRVFYNIMKQSVTFFDNSKAGELADYCNRDINEFVLFWLLDVPAVIANIIVLLLIFYLMQKINLLITLFQLIAIPLIFIPSKYFGKFINRYSKQIVKFNAKSNHVINESFLGIKTIKAMKLENYRVNLLRNLNQKTIPLFGKIAALERLYGDWAQQFISLVFIGISFALGAVQVIKGNATIGNLVLFLNYIPRFYNIITQTSLANLKLNKQLASYEKPFEFLSMKSENEVYNEPNTNFKGELAFKNVSFAYPNTEKEILKNISFNVKQGEFIGIIGQSGIGKSTIFELLVGFYNNYTGNIYIDDVEIRKLPLEYIRENITLVSQNPFLFAGTLRDNFYAVNPGAAEEDIFKAINLANISSLINSLPNGLDTYIGENGTKLSGGEKQRIYLSMALLRKSKILLLDEITSSVDTES